MFFRGKEPEQSVWRRFRSGVDGFTFVKEEDHFAAHVVANAERVVDLFHALSEQLPPAIDVVVDDRRAGRAWKGERVPLPDVRDAIARLKVPLASYGGVEIACFTQEDQLTLNPAIELFIYARTDRWYYILQGKGLEEQKRVRTKSWRSQQREFQPAPGLETALAQAIERLGLSPA
jgi:hypothetical protein